MSVASGGDAGDAVNRLDVVRLSCLVVVSPPDVKRPSEHPQGVGRRGGVRVPRSSMATRCGRAVAANGGRWSIAQGDRPRREN